MTIFCWSGSNILWSKTVDLQPEWVQLLGQLRHVISHLNMLTSLESLDVTFSSSWLSRSHGIVLQNTARFADFQENILPHLIRNIRAIPTLRSLSLINIHALRTRALHSPTMGFSSPHVHDLTVKILSNAVVGRMVSSAEAAVRVKNQPPLFALPPTYSPLTKLTLESGIGCFSVHHNMRFGQFKYPLLK